MNNRELAENIYNFVIAEKCKDCVPSAGSYNQCAILYYFGQWILSEAYDRGFETLFDVPIHKRNADYSKKVDDNIKDHMARARKLIKELHSLVKEIPEKVIQ